MFIKKHFLLSLLIILFSSCSKITSWFEPKSAWDNPLDYYDNYIFDYHINSIGQKSFYREKIRSVYVDFSDGIIQAVSTPNIKSIVDKISQKLVDENTEWYGLGSNNFKGISRLSKGDKRDVFNQVTNPESYNDKYAPIEKAIEKIVSENKDALLVTDFEDYTPDGLEQKKYNPELFIDWIKRGNSITFYYVNYDEKNKTSGLNGQKNLYFVIFTYGQKNDSSLLTDFEEAFDGREEFNKWVPFEINPKSFVFRTEYGGENKTGIIPEISSEDIGPADFEVGNKKNLVLSYHNGLDSDNQAFEAFSLGAPLKDINREYFNTENKNDNKFLQKLFLELNSNKAYKIKDVDISVTDVTEDYKHFVQSSEAQKDENKPILTKEKEESGDGENKVIWSEESLENPITIECYDKKTNKLKKEWKYSYDSKKLNKVKEIFEIDSRVKNKVKKSTDDEIEISIKFHKNFSSKKMSNTEEIILRLDVEIITDEAYSDKINDFKWLSVINRNNGMNESLYELVRNTLQKVKPDGVIYSYYFKLPSSDE